jgi:hypothetical protein
MESIPVKCENKGYICYGELSVEFVTTDLLKIDNNLWKKYDFRTKPKFGVGAHINDPSRIIHFYTNTLPLYWLLNSWTLNKSITIYRFSECAFLFKWAEHLHSVLRDKGVEDGIIVKAMFVNLLPQCSIPIHKDNGICLGLVHRYHWVISSDSSVTFTVDGDTRHWSNGYIYELNNVLYHGVDNPSDTGRIHFIMDILPNKYITSDVIYKDISPSEYSEMEELFTQKKL